jgi:hypothetical protein
MPEAIPHFGAFANPMMMDDTNLNFLSLKNLGGQSALNVESQQQDQQSQSRNGLSRMDDYRNIGSRSESNTIDVPVDVIDDLYVS